MFEELKHHVVSVVMVEIYNSSAGTLVEVYTDPSAKELGSLLLQKCAAAKHLYPIAYYSKKFKKM